MLDIGSPFSAASVASGGSALPAGLVPTVKRLKAYLPRLPKAWAKFLSARAGLNGRALGRGPAARRAGIPVRNAARVEAKALARLRVLGGET